MGHIHPGLVSVTFRKLAPGEIIELAVKAGLQAIEWGGDIHTPHGDLPCARQVRQATAAAGLQVASYGSYYRAGAEEPCPFETVLETAVELGAPVIRIWAGKLGSAEASQAERNAVLQDARRAAGLARVQNIAVAFEFHGGTLTDTPASARSLLEEADHANLFCCWQPPVGAAPEQNLQGILAIHPWLSHIHVFHWQSSADGPVQRLPLAQGQAEWALYLEQIAALSPHPRCALLEFVRGDDPVQFLQDAVVLKSWLSLFNPQGDIHDNH